MSVFARVAPDYELRHWACGTPRAHVVRCANRVDLQAAPDLRELLCRLIDLGESDLVLDLTGATFIDSTTIGVIAGRLRQLYAAGGSLVIVCTNQFILRTLEIAGMGRVLEVYRSLPDALDRGRSTEDRADGDR